MVWFHQHEFWATQEGDETARGWVITVHSPVQGLDLSWELWSHTTITTSWCSDEVTSGAPLSSHPWLPQSRAEEPEGNSTFPSTAIPSTSLDCLSSSLPTQRGELHLQLEMPPLSLLVLSWEWPTTLQVLSRVRWWLCSGEGFLSFSVARTELHLIWKRDS